MSTIISGNAANVSNSLTRTVIDATFATPVVIQTSVPHLYASGDYVSVSGVVGNTGANGFYPITVIDADHFSLTGSIGTGAWVSGGTAIDVSLTPQFTVPSDADARNAASVNVAFQALADRTQFNSLAFAPLPDLAALAAILAPVDNLTRYVVGYGSYTFKTTATTGITPFRVAAADATAGGWVAGTAHQTSRVIIINPADCPMMFPSAGAAIPPALFSSWYGVGVATILTQDSFSNAVKFTDVTAGAATARGLRVGIGAYLSDGATISRIRYTVSPSGPHGALPLIMPQAACIRQDINGTIASLLSTGGGFAPDTSPNVAAYDVLHTYDYTPDQNNVIDRTLYSYHITFWNEGNTNARANLEYKSIELTLTNIPDARRS